MATPVMITLTKCLMVTIKKWKLVKVAVLEKWMPLTALQRACFNRRRAHHQMFRLQATALLFIVKSCYQKRWRGKSDICHSHFYILFLKKILFPCKGKTSNEPLTCWAHRLPSVSELTSTVTLLRAYVSGPQIVLPALEQVVPFRFPQFVSWHVLAGSAKGSWIFTFSESRSQFPNKSEGIA